MSDLSELRAEIDAIDAELVRLFSRRLDVVNEVAAAKARAGKAVFDAEREARVLDRVAEAAGSEHADDARRLFASIFAIAKDRQRTILENARGTAADAAIPAAGRRKVRVAVAGMGLIGGSLYKAALSAGYDAVGLHHGESEGLAGADYVFVAIPPEATAPWIAEHAKDFRSGAVVMDVCGVKGAIVDAVAKIPKDGWTFVGAHPMAGREVSGYANASAELFLGKSMILTPPEGFPTESLKTLEDFIRTLGFARVVATTATLHDEMIAYTSQLCHVVATAYARDPSADRTPGFSAGSYANMTRVATMDPEMWSSLFLENRPALLAKLDGLLSRLGEFRQTLDAADRPAMEAIIAEGADAKRRELGAADAGAKKRETPEE